MIAAWMSYTLAVSALLTIAAMAADRVAAAARWPRRVPWAAALALSIAWPAAYAIARLAPGTAPAATLLPMTVTVPAIVVRPDATHLDRAAAIDRMLLALWVLTSIVLAIRLARGMFLLRQSRRQWTRHELDGSLVHIAPNVGPAVVGLRRMDLVVPEWIRSLDAPLRTIVLRHEEEHRSARDPYLLFGAALTVVVMPWNLPLWLQARRLRLAIEMDCDARVLRVHPSVDRYGLLMLTIAQRRSVAPTLFAPMLSEPTTHLERRFMAMRTTTRRLARVTVYGGSAVALGVLAFACSLQSDNGMTSPKPSTARAATPNQPYVEFTLTKQATPMPGSPAPRYPDQLRTTGVEGSVLAQFVVDTAGLVDMRTFKILKTDNELFTAAVLDNLPVWRFAPAEVNGRKVKQLVQMPFQFTLRPRGATSLEPVVVTPLGSPAGSGRDTQTVRRLPLVRSTARPGLVDANTNFREFQVEKAARPLPGNRGPRYPDALRKANLEGEVLAQFVVDTTGAAELSTFKVVRSTDSAFTNAVREALPTFRFSPAEVGGRHVRQLMEMPFEFKLARQ